MGDLPNDVRTHFTGLESRENVILAQLLLNTKKKADSLLCSTPAHM